MINVIGIGDNVCDKYKHLNKMFPGGQALNFSIYSKMLGLNSAYIGVFGNDSIAKHIIETLNKFKIDISHCRHVDGENGYAVVNIIEGERVFVKSNKGGVLKSNPIKLLDEDLDYIKRFQIIHTSNNSYIESQLDVLASLDSVLSFDFSTSWRNDIRTLNICKNINFGFMSCSDLNEEDIKEQMISAYNMGTNIVVATRGSKGSLVYDGDMFFISKPKIVKAIDTLGAGDSFSAAFLTSFVQYIWNNKNLSKSEYIELVNKCLDIANDMSAKICMTMGAFGHGIEIV